MRRKLCFSLLILLICTSMLFGAKPVPKKLLCSNCRTENLINSKYCSQCGESLEDEYAAFLAAENAKVIRLADFLEERVDPPRLFNIPTARVLSSKDISLTGGGAFGVAATHSFLGNLGIGLGNVAEVEFSSVNLMNNIARGTPSVATSSFKIKLIPERFLGIPFFPMVAVALRSSSSWKNIQSDMEALANSKPIQANSIYNINYATRLTVLYGVTTVPLGPINLHAGLSLTDIRIKDTDIFSWDAKYELHESQEKQKNLVGGFAGLDISANPQTKIMVEVETFSNWDYIAAKNMVEALSNFRGVAGIRFFFTKWLSVDTGVWYQSNYQGIADSQIKLGLNIYIPGRSIDNLPGKIVKSINRAP